MLNNDWRTPTDAGVLDITAQVKNIQSILPHQLQAQ